MALKTNVKIFRCRVSSSLRTFKDLNNGKEGAEKGWNLMHRRIFFWSRNNGVRYVSINETPNCDAVVKKGGKKNSRV